MGEFVLPPQNTLEVRNNLREEFSFIHADSADKCPTVELTREISFTISTARIKAPLAAPGKVRNKLPPLASNELFGGAPASYVLRLVYPRFRCADDAHTVAAYNEYLAVL